MECIVPTLGSLKPPGKKIDAAPNTGVIWKVTNFPNEKAHLKSWDDSEVKCGVPLKTARIVVLQAFENITIFIFIQML